ncbi:MAG: hypothetical protein D6816_00640 [Bacteroidetes bacterium]|nr:MAG: hypothetical protein D6816_00640 [Bacteroidota bacterium]
MSAIALEAFSIRVQSRDDRTNQRLDRFDGSHDFLDVLQQYLQQLRGAVHNQERSSKVLRTRTVRPNNRTLSGILESGAYGYEAPLIDIASGAQAYTRRPNEAELIPLYVLASVPANRERGILMLQRFGTMGIKSILEESLGAYFNKQFPDYKVLIHRLVPRDLIQEYLTQGGLKAITFTTFRVPRDIADLYEMEGAIEEGDTMQVRIKAKRGKYLQVPGWLQQLRDGQADVTDILEAHQEHADQISLEIKMGGKTRKLNLHNPDNFRASFDVSTQVKRGQDGHPTFDSIDAVARDLLEDIANQVLSVES